MFQDGKRGTFMKQLNLDVTKQVCFQIITFLLNAEIEYTVRTYLKAAWRATSKCLDGILFLAYSYEISPKKGYVQPSDLPDES